MWPGPLRFAKLEDNPALKLSAMESPLFTREQLRDWGVQDSHVAGWEAESSKYTFIVYAQIKQE